jgi:hypothetical protein
MVTIEYRIDTSRERISYCDRSIEFADAQRAMSWEGDVR